MKKSAIVFALSLLSLLPLPAVSSWYQSFPISQQYDLSESFDAVDTSYSSGSDYDKHLLGVLGFNDTEYSQTTSDNFWEGGSLKRWQPTTYSVFTFTINWGGGKLQFKTSDDAMAYRNFYLECIARGNSGSGGDVDYLRSAITADPVATETTPSNGYYVLKDGSLSLVFTPSKPSGSVNYKTFHIDFILVLPSDFNEDDLIEASNYTGKISIDVTETVHTIKQKQKWSWVWNDDGNSTDTTENVLSSFPLDLSGFYGTGRPSGYLEYQFGVNTTALSDRYEIKSPENDSYRTVANINFSTSTFNGNSIPSARYGIVVSPSSVWNDTTGKFQFSHVSDGACDIPFYCRVVGGTKNGVTMASTPDDLEGNEAIATSGAASSSNSRLLIASQISTGSHGSINYYNYEYAGDVQIRMPEEVQTDDSLKSGLYRSNIYIHLITLE